MISEFLIAKEGHNLKQWECIVCGWVYDEAVGDPDSGIAPGTKFEDIPDDWMCPECGVGKDDFELVELATPLATSAVEQNQNSSSTTGPIIIVGAGLAGYGLLKEFRKLNESQQVILICKDDGRAYSKPALSTGYTKNTSGADLTQGSAAQQAADLHAHILTHAEVTSIDTASQTVTINNGQGTFHYAKLILAQGAHCISPPLQGDASERVLSINDLSDFEHFQATAQKLKAKRIGLIGAGLIGSEYNNDLLNGGFKTVSIDPLNTCLSSLLPTVAGQAVQASLEEMGAEFHFGNTVKTIEQTAAGLCMRLDDDTEIIVDMVLSAVGVKPNTVLAESAGLAFNRGINTNRFLRTSVENIFALGDCAEVDGLALVYIAPLHACAKALAKTLNGEPTAVRYPAMPIIVKTPACPVVVCPPMNQTEGEWHLVEQSGTSVRTDYKSQTGELLGFALTGNCTGQKSSLVESIPAWLA